MRDGGYRDRGAYQGGYGVQAAGEDCRDLPHQDVADRPAADGGDGSENDGLPGAEAVLQGFGRAGDAEQAQPGGVQQQDVGVNRRSCRLRKNAISAPPAATAR